MSEMFTKIISTDPDSTRIWELKDKINEAFGEKYKIKFEQSDAAQFEDCGENLEEIICPVRRLTSTGGARQWTDTFKTKVRI